MSRPGAPRQNPCVKKMSGERVGGRAAGTSLAERLRARIRRAGPMAFRDWMQAALYDPEEGYYQRRGHARWGRAGDYRTAPETTPLFAATFARHFASLHEELHSPPELNIVEAGAGAGHFARCVLGTLRRDHPKVFSCVRYAVDELSADSRARAAELLAPFAGRVEFQRIEERRAPFEAGIIFSNELLDAFPVHRVVSRGGELRELCVGLDERGAFSWVEREPSTPQLAAHLRAGGVTLSEGQIAEVNLEAGLWIARAASALKRGFVITVDYGAEAAGLYGGPGRAGGTLRGYAAHKLADDVLDRPGLQDLTTTVDWTQVVKAGEDAGLQTISFEPLGKFLMGAGFLEQLERESVLAAGEPDRAQLSLGARELILPGGLGESFQVLVQKKAAPP